jgi:hypothetical protein
VITRTKLFALLALPAGAIGYAVATSILMRLGVAEGVGNLILLFVPLFVAGLCMVPFLIPLFDSMAKRDLAAIQARRAAEGSQVDGADTDIPPG